MSESSERWWRIEEICSRAMGLDSNARKLLLDEACGNDPALRQEVESLLAHEGEARGFLETPAMEVAARRLSGDVDADLIGRSIGPYVIEAWLGSGGMGDVYRARDVRLNRGVALKILPGLFALDGDRIARFESEARVLASLDHPNIAAIYGFEEVDGLQALVLELVEGLTLAEQCAQSRMSLDEVWPIARQIAEALEAAHEHGIVHCDLKPANIAVRTDGTVKLLDFGLARAMEPAAAVASDASPAVMLPGTAAYMSPEQAKGRPADKRSNVWAFGAILYEMLSGRPAYDGENVAETLSAVTQQDVDWSALPLETPPSVRHLLARCLDRDVKRRLRDIGEARIVLEDPPTDLAHLPARAPSRPRRTIDVLVPALAASLVVAIVAWQLRSGADLPASVTRFQYTLPEGQSISLPASRHAIAVSPDGSHMVYVARGRLYLRSMSQLNAQAIAGTESYRTLTEPVFSPDGRSIAFWAGSDNTIKRVATGGGVAVTLCSAANPHGMNWQREGILFGQGNKGIMRVSVDGGPPETLVQVEKDEEAHGPQLLPDGEHVLFTLAKGTDFERWERARIVVQSLVSGERRTLIRGGTDARYTPTGHLVYEAGGVLLAVAFDAKKLRVSSAPVPLVEGVRRSYSRETGAAHFSFADTGSLIYIGGGLAGPEQGMLQIVRTDPNGRATVLPVPPGPYQGGLRVSPDGSRIAFGADDGTEAVVWTYDLAGNTPMRRITFGGNNRFPIWTSDGKGVAFQSDRDGDAAIFRQQVEDPATAERLTSARPGEAHVPESWSPDGEHFLFSVSKGSDVSLWTFSLADRKATPFGNVHSANPTGAVFSPDGRWVAYTTTEAGRAKMAIFVQPFPATGAKYQLVVEEPGDASAGTPHRPVWSPDGKGLFYVPRLGELEFVSVTTRPGFAFGKAVRVARPFAPGAPNFRRLFDITPEGTFVGIMPVGSADSSADTTAPHIDVVLNWFEELRVRVPPRK